MPFLRLQGTRSPDLTLEHTVAVHLLDIGVKKNWGNGCGVKYFLYIYTVILIWNTLIMVGGAVWTVMLALNDRYETNTFGTCSGDGKPLRWIEAAGWSRPEW